MNRLFFIIFFIVATPICVFAQVDEITLVVSGEGETKEKAVHNALRYAVEQAFGVFVSANTSLLNDEVVRDEIATLTTGNIKSFTELAAVESHSGPTSVTLEVVVSVGKLIEYSKSHGSSAEFAGLLFGSGLKLRKINTYNEPKVLHSYLSMVDPSLLFNAQISLGTPFKTKVSSFTITENSKNVVSYHEAGFGVGYPSFIDFPVNNWVDYYSLPITINYTPTDYGVSIFEKLEEVLRSLSIDDELEQYNQENELFFAFKFNSKQYYFRSSDSVNLLADYLSYILVSAFFSCWEIDVHCGNEETLPFAFRTGRFETGGVNPNRNGGGLSCPYHIGLSLFHHLSPAQEWWLNRVKEVKSYYYHDKREEGERIRGNIIELIKVKYQISSFEDDKSFGWGSWTPTYDYLWGYTLRVNAANPAFDEYGQLRREKDGSHIRHSTLFIIPFREEVETVDVMTYTGGHPFSWERDESGYSNKPRYSDVFVSKALDSTMNDIDNRDKCVYQINFYLPIEEAQLVKVTSIDINKHEE